jgi:hypothetical protein
VEEKRITVLGTGEETMADTKVYRASTTAPVNIAVIKYASHTTGHFCLCLPLPNFLMTSLA